MRLTALLLLVGAGLLLAAQPAAREDPALQGTWSLASVEVNGQPLPIDKLKDALLTIDGNEYVFEFKDIRLEMLAWVDEFQTPMTIDLEVMKGPDKGKIYHGIYHLENGEYTICRPMEPDKARPTEFATYPNSGLMMVVWKRLY